MIKQDDTHPVINLLCKVALGLLVMSLFFWPKFWRYQVFGPEPGSEPDVAVERTDLIVRCEEILNGMEKTEREMRKLEADARRLERAVNQLRDHPDVDIERLDASAIPELLDSVKRSAERRTLVRLGTYRENLASVRAKLTAGEYPGQFADFVAKAEAALRQVDKENQRRLNDAKDLDTILDD